MSKIQLTESELKQIVESAAKQILNEGVYVDFSKLPEKNINDTDLVRRPGFWGSREAGKVKERLENGQYLGKQAAQALKNLGYSDAEIEAGYRNGAISFYKHHTSGRKSDYNYKRYNRMDRKFRKRAGNIQPLGSASARFGDSPADSSAGASGADAAATAPAAGTEVTTRTVYYKPALYLLFNIS